MSNKINFTPETLKALRENKGDAESTFRQKAGRSTGKAMKNSADALSKGAEAVRGVMPVTTRRFEGEHEDRVRGEEELHEKVDFLYELLGAEYPKEVLDQMVEERFEERMKEEEREKEARKKKARQSRKDLLAKTRETLFGKKTEEEPEERTPMASRQGVDRMKEMLDEDKSSKQVQEPKKEKKPESGMNIAFDE